MRIASSFALLGIAMMSACSTDSTGPVMSSQAAPDVARFDRSSNTVGHVFTMSNAVAGNSVLAFGRAADGSLHQVGTFATGGVGTGSGLGNQGALTLDEEGRTLF